MTFINIAPNERRKIYDYAQGMREEEILADDEEIMRRKDELTAKFHETFARKPEETTDEMNKRRLDALFSIQAEIMFPKTRCTLTPIWASVTEILLPVRKSHLINT